MRSSLLSDIIASIEGSAEDFAGYAARCLMIRTKAGALERLRLNAAQRCVHEAIERQLRETGKARALILKGRQQGASTYVEARYFWKVTYGQGLRAFILCHADFSSRAIFDMAKRFFDHCPPGERESIKASNARELVFDKLDSGYTVATAGSKGAGRSETVQLFHGSEVAYWPSGEEHLAGALQAVPDAPGSEIILESTSAGPQGLFFAMCEAAQRGESDYQLIFVPWFIQAEYRRTVPEGFELTEDERAYAAAYNLDREQMAWRRAKIIELHGIWNFRREYPSDIGEAFKTEPPGALWRRELIEGTRVREAPALRRVVVGVDPSGGSKSSNDEAGIVVAGLAADGCVYVLADLSGRMSPNEWGNRTIAGYQRHKADRIIAEGNFGGEMVRHTIATIDRNAPVKIVTASRGKFARAEPVASIYEMGKAHHVGTFAALEDELCTWDPSKTQRSPNRLDALVWAITELCPVQDNTGIIEYYRREAEKIAKLAAGADKHRPAATLDNGGVRMKCREGVNCIYDLCGRPVYADADGIIVVEAKHADILKRAGFTLVDTE